jgi:hypothetical protein
LDIDLDECAGQSLRFPRRGRLACAQANDDVLPADRLSGVERDVLDDAVALVEDRQHRDALSHGRDAGLIDARRHRGVGDHRRARVLLVATAAGRKRERDQNGRRENPHAYSGVQGS